MAKQEKRISYKAGITRTPSDFLCQDGDLAECINLTTDNEELKPMVQPAVHIDKAVGTDGTTSITMPTIAYVHRVNGGDIYICYSLSEGVYTMEYGIRIVETGRATGTYKRTDLLQVGTSSLTNSNPPTNVVSIGKILIVSFTDNTYYFRWDPSGGYKGLSSSIPDIKVEFMSYDLRQEDPGRPTSFSISDIVHHDDYIQNPNDPLDICYKLNTRTESEYEAIKDVLIGAVSERISKVAEQKRFAFPYWVRYAVRLYDCSYTAISQPFLMFPTVNHNCDIFFSGVDGVPQHMRNQEWPHGQNINYLPYSAELSLRIPTIPGVDLSDWADVIAGVDIFVSEQQTPFNIEGDWHFINPFDTEHQGNYVLYNHADGPFREETITDTEWGDSSTLQLGFVTYFGMTHIDESEIMKNLLDKSIFYRIAQIDLAEFGNYSGFRTISDKLTQTTLKTLTSQTRLEYDDYFSRNIMTAGIMKAYNARLHLADVSRHFFEGFGEFTEATYNIPIGSSTPSYLIAVSISTDSGVRLVTKNVASTDKIMDIWFYYPDPRATRVQIYKKTDQTQGYLVYDKSLTEHQRLNGAYFFDHLPSFDDTVPSGTTPVDLPLADDVDEVIRDRVYVSETDNPFVFTSKGEVRVGQGDIIGLATQTVALGQEEHGLHPLIVFTDRGISTLKVSDEGYYLRSDELNREVCINPKSITETDGAVFFVSKKGLMVLVGEQIKCVSEQINGLPFSADGIVGLTGNADPWASIITACKDWYLDGNQQRKTLSFLDYVADKRCRIAYDYIDSRLLMINPSRNFVFVYNMKDGSISKTVLPGTMTEVVSNYPDYILQSGGNIYTLYNKPREDEITTRQRAFILTRPIKLAGPLTVSSLRELVNVGYWDKGTLQSPLKPVQTTVWLSDDLLTWHEMSSRFGAAAKYFRIGLFINMLPTERLSGTILMEQERRTDNKRA